MLNDSVSPGSLRNSVPSRDSLYVDGHFIRERSQTYLARVKDARVIALTTNSAERRRIWKAIAADWERMAEDADRAMKADKPSASGH